MALALDRVAPFSAIERAADSTLHSDEIDVVEVTVIGEAVVVEVIVAVGVTGVAVEVIVVVEI